VRRAGDEGRAERARGRGADVDDTAHPVPELRGEPAAHEIEPVDRLGVDDALDPPEQLLEMEGVVELEAIDENEGLVDVAPPDVDAAREVLAGRAREPADGAQRVVGEVRHPVDLLAAERGRHPGCARVEGVEAGRDDHLAQEARDRMKLEWHIGLGAVCELDDPLLWTMALGPRFEGGEAGGGSGEGEAALGVGAGKGAGLTEHDFGVGQRPSVQRLHDAGDLCSRCLLRSCGQGWGQRRAPEGQHHHGEHQTCHQDPVAGQILARAS
jgi:hypothetical protein